ncbi:uncharacterized protein LOC133906358 [Phragmites australis]|uniref:uncharacterized protein LOC133906358 n=1 Tax=Phragmites australis TaxID=29695 RepID=UPI002D78211F|nr:uncharacterized protein LOC133906358 [Phragmites australis]
MPSATACPVAPTPAAQPALPDELLEDIFLRLGDAADLARASASCTSFRRVISSRLFLRRFRSLHPPPVLGFLYSSGGNVGFHAAQPPRRSAPAGRAFDEAVDFTFSFLPDPSCWRVGDVRDGRVLLSRYTATCFIFEDLVVCDPLHRRYVHIPPISGDLATSTGHGGMQKFEPFLAPAGDEQEEAERSLRVICNVMSKYKVVPFVYSSVTGKWGCVTPFSIVTDEWMVSPTSLQHRCVHSCFYWTGYCEKVMLMLDVREMKFSVIDLPPDSNQRYKTIVEAGEGRIGLFVLGDRELDLYSKTWRDNGVGAKEWRHDNVIPLPNCHWTIAGAAEGYILLRGILRDYSQFWSFPSKPDAHYFTLELKTLLIERLCASKFDILPDYLYASFPPPLSPPSI